MVEGRTVRAVVTSGTRVLGALPPFAVDIPWWVETAPIVAELDRRLGVRTSVLRLVRVDGGAVPRDGLVTYQVEVTAPHAVRPQDWQPIDPEILVAVTMDDPRRPSYARPGGPTAEVAWADQVLAAQGHRRTAPPLQFKTWNLSCVHRLSTTRGEVWAKRVPSFQTRESVVVEAVAQHDRTLVPEVLAADEPAGRTLARHVAGEDCWEADDRTVTQAIERWVSAQAALADQADRLIGAGVPHWSAATIGDRVGAILDDPVIAGLAVPSAPPRCASLADLSPLERSRVGDLLEQLPDRLAALARAGLPDTLVHGDFQPGNWRSDGHGLVVMDWADASINSPVLDLACTLGRLSVERHPVAIDAWVNAWRSHRPGCAPEAAVELGRALLFLQGAFVYQRFLDHIEPSEWIYHQHDPAEQLRLALAAW